MKQENPMNTNLVVHQEQLQSKTGNLAETGTWVVGDKLAPLPFQLAASTLQPLSTILQLFCFQFLSPFSAFYQLPETE